MVSSHFVTGGVNSLDLVVQPIPCVNIIENNRHKGGLHLFLPLSRVEFELEKILISLFISFESIIIGGGEVYGAGRADFGLHLACNNKSGKTDSWLASLTNDDCNK